MNEEQKEHIESMKQVVREEMEQCGQGIEIVEGSNVEDEEHLRAMIAVLKKQALGCVWGCIIIHNKIRKYEGAN